MNPSQGMAAGIGGLIVTAVSFGENSSGYPFSVGSRESKLHSQQRRGLQQGAGGPAPATGPNVLVAQSLPDRGLRFASLLRQAFPKGWVMVSGSVRDAVAVLEHQPIDMAVIDPRLPDGSGLHVVQRCLRTSQLTRSVITLAEHDEIYFMEALAAGALGYLLENEPDSVVIRQLQLLAEGIPPLAPAVAGRLLHYFTARPTSFKAGLAANDQAEEVRLSDAEERVLTLIAVGRWIGDVARLLEMSTDDVCGHVKSIYLKRHLASRAETALEFNYPSVA
ncbi:response regulator transcription factor [Steroidobacter sp. S1-65]|uniref:Response regulator transcription factor n=1 Tax=Steroidobacter gossypii TaxID=2805490 RepID=A0ABS1WZD7_9GAMM|nr:response regulator [Steroidobacter gossypii]MBM0106342.1 response regulator transcription factor [Steroidobacter gossypii]